MSREAFEDDFAHVLIDKSDFVTRMAIKEPSKKDKKKAQEELSQKIKTTTG